jgi:hypothetical protein
MMILFRSPLAMAGLKEDLSGRPDMEIVQGLRPVTLPESKFG